MEKIGIAVIGCGRIGMTHLEALKDLMGKEQTVRLVATADPQGNQAEQCGQRYGAEFSAKNYREALSHPGVHAVVLALPNNLHAPITIEAAEAGKHILVEKPMANTAEEADRMVQAADRAGVKLMVAHSRRYIKALYTAWEMIDEIGTPINMVYLSLAHQSVIPAYMYRKETSGHLVFSALGAHTVDYILWLLKQKKRPVRVYAEGYSNVPELEGKDEASMLITFDDGAIATTTLSMSNRTPRVERIVIIGTKGSMHLEHAYASPAGSPGVGAVHSRMVHNDRVVWDGIQGEWNFTLQMKAFIDCIREGRSPISDGRDVRHVIPIIEAADLSAERHEAVTLLQPI
jgi:UDP-N-acetylglucosamine 3-dehydrogenase